MELKTVPTSMCIPSAMIMMLCTIKEKIKKKIDSQLYIQPVSREEESNSKNKLILIKITKKGENISPIGASY